MKNNTIHVCIAPARQIATVKQGKKVLKRYNFKMVVPFEIEKKESYSHDYSNWCVSERDSMRIIEVKVYCKETMQELKIKTLEYYLKQKQL